MPDPRVDAPSAPPPVERGDANVEAAIGDFMTQFSANKSAEPAAAPAVPPTAQPVAAPAPVTPVAPATPAAPAPAAPVPPVAPVTPAPAAPAPAAPVVKPAVPGVPADVFKPKEGAAPAAPVSAADAIKAPSETEKDPKARDAWAALKRLNKSQETEIATLMDKVKLLESKKPDVSIEEVAELKKQVTDYENRVGQLDLSQTKAFQERYDTPIKALVDRGVRLLIQTGKEEGVAREVMTRLIQTGGDVNKIQDILAEEPVAVQSSLLNQVLEVRETAINRQQALEDWRATRTILNDGVERQSTADHAAAVVQATRTAVDDLVAEGSWAFQRSEEDPAWNTQRDDLIRAGQRILHENNGGEIAKYVLEGLMASTYRKSFEAAHHKCVALQAELDSLVGATPAIGSSGESPAAPAAKPNALNVTDWLSAEMAKKAAGAQL